MQPSTTDQQVNERKSAAIAAIAAVTPPAAASDDINNADINRVTDFFNDGRVLFITGGSGFVGKVLIEKLLRFCPRIGRIYLLVREKKSKSPTERLATIFSNPLFDKVRDLYGNEYIYEKCKALTGNVAELNLGLCEEDRSLIVNEVEIIYHCAAIIRFDETLANMVRTNVRGTKLMLELAKECRKLRLFAYMSTAYCHLDQKVLKEEFYPPMYDPHMVIRTIEWLDDDIVNLITKQIIGACPNTYAFSKNLAEGLVHEVRNELPVVLMRPSIIIPIWLEPIPGWTDNINGPTGLLIGAGKGVIRTMYCNDSRHADFVPVDIVANSVLCATWHYCHVGTLRVFHLTTSHRLRVSWKTMIDVGRKVINERLPLNWVVWYPDGSMVNNRFVHQMRVLLYHYLPALFIDFWLLVFGYKPILWKIQQRITKGCQMFEYYANNEWVFENHIDDIAREVMNKREKLELKMTEDGLDFEDYFYHCTHAARLYILKESDESIPTAKRHMKIMWFVDLFTKALLLVLFVYFFVYKYLF